MKLKNKTLTEKLFFIEVCDSSNSKASKIQSHQKKRKVQNKKDDQDDIEDEKEDSLYLRSLKPFSNSLPGAE